MKIHNFEQRTDEWFAIRKWKLTASKADAIATAKVWLDTYCKEIMADKYSKIKEESYTNDDIERWVELEYEARNIYELETWNTVEEVWFVEFDDMSWFSPDWLVWDDWGIEIKCMNNKNHFNFIIDREIPSKYMWQIQLSLLLSDRKWWDFISYNPNYDNAIVIERVLPDDDKFEKLSKWLEIGKKKLKEIEELYLKSIK